MLELTLTLHRTAIIPNDFEYPATGLSIEFCVIVVSCVECVNL